MLRTEQCASPFSTVLFSIISVENIFKYFREERLSLSCPRIIKPINYPSGKNQPQGPTRTGRNGKKDATDAGNKSSSQPKKNLKKPSREERGRSPKRKPPRDFSSHHDDDSYDNRSNNRSSSRRKYKGRDNHRPCSILKKRVRFQSEKKGRGGRGQGGREGRGGAPSGSRRGRGGRT